MTEESNKLNLTPAALAAGLRGDIKNFMVASTPGGIERQEAEGQSWMCGQPVLPKERYDFKEKAYLVKCGFKFLTEYDDLFVNVVFPLGWTVKPSDSHSMWSSLLDAKGHMRGSIFYKAAFYDRSAKLRLESRYAVNSEHRDTKDTADALYACIQDAQSDVPVHFEMFPFTRYEEDDRNRYLASDGESSVRRDARDKLTAILQEKYPEWRDATAYWED